MSFPKWFVDVVDTDSGECYVKAREHLSATLATDTMIQAAEYYQVRETKVLITLRNELGYLIATLKNYETDNICRDEQQAGESSALLEHTERQDDRPGDQRPQDE